MVGDGDGPVAGLRRAAGDVLLAVSTLTWLGGLLVAPWLPLPAASRVTPHIAITRSGAIREVPV